MAVSNGTSPRTGGTGTPAQSVVAAYGAPLGDLSPQRRVPTGGGGGGGGGSYPVVGRCRLWGACGGWRPPTARTHWLGGRGGLPRRVAAYGAPRRDGNPKHRSPTGWVDGECSPVFGRRLWKSCVGCEPTTARAHGLQGQGVLPSQWSLLKGCLSGIAAPNGAGPQAWGTASSADLLVLAYAPPAGVGSPQLWGPTGWGDGESYPVGGCCLWRACGGW